MKEFYGIDYHKGLDIDWNITTLCQYKCPYCYVKRTNELISKHNIDCVIKNLKNSVHEMTVNILGGEPTLHPQLNYIISELNKIKNVTKITLITNGDKDLSKLLVVPNMEILFSYHITTNDSNFLKNINLLKDKLKIRVSIMQFGNLERRQKMYDTLSELGIEVFQDPIVINKVIKAKRLNIPNKKEFIFDNKEYDTDIIFSKLDFYGWNCEFSYCSIDPDGNLYFGCDKTPYNVYKSFDVLTHPVKTIKCDKHQCLDSCLLTMYKCLD